MLVLGLGRTGSGSMAEALRRLGYPRVHHGLEHALGSKELLCLERAAEATFPSLQHAGEPRPEPFTRRDWDEVFGDYDVVTEAGSIFALQLIEAYPEAKVILTDRDCDEWAESFEAVIIGSLWPSGAVGKLRKTLAWCLVGLQDRVNLQTCLRKLFLGFFEASNAQEIRANMRGAYKRHQQQIRDAVAPDRLLVYHLGKPSLRIHVSCRTCANRDLRPILGDGWKPLCEFLGKEMVPSTTPFPHRYKREEFQAMRRNMIITRLKSIAWNLFLYALIAAVIAVVALRLPLLAQLKMRLALWTIPTSTYP